MTALGFEFPPVSHLFEWPDILLKDTPLAVNKTVLLMWVTVLVLSVLFVVVARNFTTIPGKLQSVVESVVNFIDQGIVHEVMGPEGRAWTPYLTTLFLFIFFLNIFEVLPPISFPATSRMAIPMFLSAVTWVLFVTVGIVKQGPKYFVSVLFPPGVPKALYILVTPIELFSTFVIRPISLAVRLFANLFAGHLLLTVFFLLTASVWALKPSIAILPVTLGAAIGLTGFEMLVALLQAYIFTILTAVYIGESMHPHH